MGKRKAWGVVRRNVHPGDQEMGTPGACNAASGSSLQKKPQQPPGSEPRARPGNAAALPFPFCWGDALEPLAQDPDPQARVSYGSLYQVPDTRKLKPGLCWALGTLPWGVHRAPIRSETLWWRRPAQSGRNECSEPWWVVGPSARGAPLPHPKGSSQLLPDLIFQEKPEI